jgi:sugar phosphate isomerase/epimerase
MNRRRFLATSLGATAAAIGSQAAHASLGEGGRMRFGACDWTLKLSCDPAVFPLAKRIGLDGVQVDFGRETDATGALPLADKGHQDRLLEAADTSGVAIPSLAMGVLNKFCLKDNDDAFEWVIQSVPVAKRMKTPVVLLAFFGKGDLVDDEAGFQKVIDRLKMLAPIAEQAGITYGIESWLKAPRLEEMLDAVASPAIRVYYDVGNMDKVGEDYVDAIRRLGRERICEFHAKDYHGLYGIDGNIDFGAVKGAIDEIGFSGWMHIEGTKFPNGVEQDCRTDLKHLRSIFS